MPLSFVLHEKYTTIHVPRIARWHGQTYTSCARLCEQFWNYPTINMGIRVIPQDAVCPRTNKECHVQYCFVGGKFDEFPFIQRRLLYTLYNAGATR